MLDNEDTEIFPCFQVVTKALSLPPQRLAILSKNREARILLAFSPFHSAKTYPMASKAPPLPPPTSRLAPASLNGMRNATTDGSTIVVDGAMDSKSSTHPRDPSFEDQCSVKEVASVASVASIESSPAAAEASMDPLRQPQPNASAAATATLDNGETALVTSSDCKKKVNEGSFASSATSGDYQLSMVIGDETSMLSFRLPPRTKAVSGSGGAASKKPTARKGKSPSKPKPSTKGASSSPRPLKKQLCSTSTDPSPARSTATEQKAKDQKVLHSAGADDSAGIEKYFSDHKAYQDSLVNDYLEQKYRECVLNMPVVLPGLVNMQGAAWSSEMPFLADPPTHSDVSSGQKYAPFCTETSTSKSSRTVIMAGHGKSVPPPPPSPECDELVVDLKTDLMDEPCSSPTGSYGVSSIETIEKDVSDDYAPIDFTRANSEDLYKTLLKFDTQLDLMEAPENGNDTDVDAEAESLDFLFPSPSLQSQHTTKTAMRVSPDPIRYFHLFEERVAATGAESLVLDEDLDVLDHQMPFLVPDDDTFQHYDPFFESIGSGEYTATTNLLSDDGTDPSDIHNTDPALQIKETTDQLYLLQERNEQSFESDPAFGPSLDHFETFQWGENHRWHDHVDGNSSYPHLVGEHMFQPLQNIRAPKRVSFAPAEVKTTIARVLDFENQPRPYKENTVPLSKITDATISELVQTVLKNTFESAEGAPRACSAGKRKTKTKENSKAKTFKSSPQKKMKIASPAPLMSKTVLGSPPSKAKDDDWNRNENKASPMVSKKFSKAQGEKWLKHYQDAIEFGRREGHCAIPLVYPNNKELAGWAKRQVRMPSAIMLVRNLRQPT